MEIWSPHIKMCTLDWELIAVIDENKIQQSAMEIDNKLGRTLIMKTLIMWDFEWTD